MIAATYANFENNTGKFGKPFVMTKVTLRIPYVYDFKKTDVLSQFTTLCKNPYLIVLIHMAEYFGLRSGR